MAKNDPKPAPKAAEWPWPRSRAEMEPVVQVAGMYVREHGGAKPDAHVLTAKLGGSIASPLSEAEVDFACKEALRRSPAFNHKEIVAERWNKD